MLNLNVLYLVFLVAMAGWLAACAPDPSLGDPYADNGFFWPYDSDEPEEEASVCPEEPVSSLGTLADGSPINSMAECNGASEGDFPVCARFSEDGELQVVWDGVNGFAVFVTEPEAVIPTAPNTPVSEGDTFWSIGPVSFPTDGFSSPLTYQQLPEGMEDVTTDHGGPDGGLSLESGRCYKITVINKSFRRASTIVGWQ